MAIVSKLLFVTSLSFVLAEGTDQTRQRGVQETSEVPQGNSPVTLQHAVDRVIGGNAVDHSVSSHDLKSEMMKLVEVRHFVEKEPVGRKLFAAKMVDSMLRNAQTFAEVAQGRESYLVEEVKAVLQGLRRKFDFVSIMLPYKAIAKWAKSKRLSPLTVESLDEQFGHHYVLEACRKTLVHHEKWPAQGRSKGVNFAAEVLLDNLMMRFGKTTESGKITESGKNARNGKDCRNGRINKDERIRKDGKSTEPITSAPVITRFLEELPIAEADLVLMLGKMLEHQASLPLDGRKRYSEKALRYLTAISKHKTRMHNVKAAASKYATMNGPTFTMNDPSVTMNDPSVTMNGPSVTIEKHREFLEKQLLLAPLDASADELQSILTDQAFASRIGEAGVQRLRARTAVLQRFSSGVPSGDAVGLGDTIDLSVISKSVSIPVQVLEHAVDCIAMHNPELVPQEVLLGHLATSLYKADFSKLETTPTRTRVIVLGKNFVPMLTTLAKNSHQFHVLTHQFHGLTTDSFISKMSEAVNFWSRVDSAKASLLECPWTRPSGWYLYLASVDVSPVFAPEVRLEHIRAACAELEKAAQGRNLSLYKHQLIEYVDHVNEHGVLPTQQATIPN